MFECGQRSSLSGAVLAAFVVFGAASCSGDTSSPPLADKETPAPPTTAAAPTTTESPDSDSEAPSSSTDTTPPSDSAEPEAAGPNLPEAELESFDDIPGLIAYRAGTGDIVTSTPSRTAQTVWADGAQFFNMQPTWARSGRVLAWSRSNQTGSDVVIANVADSQTEPLEAEALPSPFYLSWSPGDTNLLGLRNGTQGIEVLVIDASSGETTSASLGQPFFTDWMSDESLAAVIGGRFLADVDTTTLIPLVRETPNPLGLFESPIALDDGAVIATTTNGLDNTIVEIGDDGTVVELAHARGPVRMSLSPDGQRLAVSVAAGDQELELISYAPFAQGEDVPDLESGRVSIIDRASRDVLTRTEVNVLGVNWSPTGQHLALLVGESNQLRWVFADASTTDEQVSSVGFAPSREFATAYLPFIDQYDRSSTWWSPDGRAFVFAGGAYGRNGVWVDRIDDEEGPAFLSDGDIAFWSPE